MLNLATSKEGADLTRDHDLIVIYPNRIDRIGDTRESEADTCQAVEDSFADLDKILRKIASLKGSQAVITADHGFLFQQEPVEPKKRLPLQLRIGLYAKADGALLCAHRNVLLDSAAREAREREQPVVLELSNAAGDYNNQLLELRLER